MHLVTLWFDVRRKHAVVPVVEDERARTTQDCLVNAALAVLTLVVNLSIKCDLHDVHVKQTHLLQTPVHNNSYLVV